MRRKMEHITDYILTDEFVEYSKQIAELHAAKKAKTEEIKAIYAKAKEEMAGLDARYVREAQKSLFHMPRLSQMTVIVTLASSYPE